MPFSKQPPLEPHGGLRHFDCKESSMLWLFKCKVFILASCSDQESHFMNCVALET